MIWGRLGCFCDHKTYFCGGEVLCEGCNDFSEVYDVYLGRSDVSVGMGRCLG
jgi:hypothetical protein